MTDSSGHECRARDDDAPDADEPVLIRPVQESDAEDWARMRQVLWPSAPGEHAAEIECFFRGDRSVAAQVFVAVDHVAGQMGLAEVSTRSYAEGCHSDRVAYSKGGRWTRAIEGRGSEPPCAGGRGMGQD